MLKEARRRDGVAVVASGLTKRYGRGERAIDALRAISAVFDPGSFTAVMGPSGSGKSTLLRCAAGLEDPTAGRVRIGEVELSALREPRRTEERRRHVAFLFQDYNLIDSISVRANVELPVRLAGARVDRRRTAEILDRLGLGARAGARPGELSGGQQQRVAVARALVQRAGVLFADEPTGALDRRTGDRVLDLLRESGRATGRTTIMVTHDPRAAATAERVLFLADGRLAGELTAPTADAVAAWLARLEG